MRMKIRMGGLDKGQLRDALLEQKVQWNQAAEDLFDDARFCPAKEAREIEVQTLSVLELGFPQGATYGQLIEKADALGFEECPLELGPHLRLAFLTQPPAPIGQSSKKGKAPDESLTVASTPISADDSVPKGFYLKVDEYAIWLRGYWSDLDHVWQPENVLVFCAKA